MMARRSQHVDAFFWTCNVFAERNPYSDYDATKIINDSPYVDNIRCQVWLARKSPAILSRHALAGDYYAISLSYDILTVEGLLEVAAKAGDREALYLYGRSKPRDNYIEMAHLLGHRKAKFEFAYWNRKQRYNLLTTAYYMKPTLEPEFLDDDFEKLHIDAEHITMKFVPVSLAFLHSRVAHNKRHNREPYVIGRYLSLFKNLTVPIHKECLNFYLVQRNGARAATLTGILCLKYWHLHKDCIGIIARLVWNDRIRGVHYSSATPSPPSTLLRSAIEYVIRKIR